MKSIKPRKIDTEAMYQAIEKEVNSIANDLILEFELTSATWKHEVKYEKIVQVGPDDIGILVGTDDQIWNWVDQGTKPHTIRPRNKPFLAYRKDFRPKSTPGSQTSGYGYTGGPWVYTRKPVQHPGTKKRNFSKTIRQRFSSTYRTRMQKAFDEAAKVSGHEVE